MKPLDRIDIAIELAEGARVLDIGGMLMPECNKQSRFARKYARIKDEAATYVVMDKQEGADVVADLSTAAGFITMQDYLEKHGGEFDLILCMETLEHILWPSMTLRVIARCVDEHDSAALITLPNVSNWLIHAMGWHYDHLCAYTRRMAERFVMKCAGDISDIQIFDAIGKYHPLWWLFWAAGFFQPVSFGFVLWRKVRKTSKNKNKKEREAK